MEKPTLIIHKRRLHDTGPKSAFWASKTPQERIAALEIIRGTANAEQKLPRVYQITRGKRG